MEKIIERTIKMLNEGGNQESWKEFFEKERDYVHGLERFANKDDKEALKTVWGKFVYTYNFGKRA